MTHAPCLPCSNMLVWLIGARCKILLFGNDIVLLVLHIAPIKGITVLQKQVFLTSKEVFSEQAIDFGYFLYRYDAYSKIIADTVKILQEEELIKVIKRKGEGSLYRITDEG